MERLHFLDKQYILQLLVIFSLIEETCACDICDSDWFKWTLGFLAFIVIIVIFRLLHLLKRRSRVRNSLSNARAPKDADTSGRPTSLPPMRRASSSGKSVPAAGSRGLVMSAPAFSLDTVTQPVTPQPYPGTTGMDQPQTSNRGWPAEESSPPGYVINLSYANESSVPQLPPIALPTAPPPSYNSVMNAPSGHM